MTFLTLYMNAILLHELFLSLPELLTSLYDFFSSLSEFQNSQPAHHFSTSKFDLSQVQKMVGNCSRGEQLQIERVTFYTGLPHSQRVRFREIRV